jgi:hypothetical protein
MHLRTSSQASNAMEDSFVILVHIRFKSSFFILILKNLTQMTGTGPTNDLLENEKTNEVQHDRGSEETSWLLILV